MGGKRGKEEQAWIDEGRKETLSMYSGIKNFHLCRFGDFLLMGSALQSPFTAEDELYLSGRFQLTKHLHRCQASIICFR